MAKIRLTPEAARAVHRRLSAAGDDLGSNECGKFKGRSSDSEMMNEFEQRVHVLQKQIDQYKAILDKDLYRLDKACKAIVASDQQSASKMKKDAGILGKASKSDKGKK